MQVGWLTIPVPEERWGPWEGKPAWDARELHLDEGDIHLFDQPTIVGEQ